MRTPTNSDNPPGDWQRVREFLKRIHPGVPQGGTPRQRETLPSERCYRGVLRSGTPKQREALPSERCHAGVRECELQRTQRAIEVL